MPRGASFGVFPYLHEFLLREPYIEKRRGAPAKAGARQKEFP